MCLWSGSDLTHANLTGANLSGSLLINSNLTGANLTGAVVRGAFFLDTTSRGFTKEQLYSTASYQAKDLSGIELEEMTSPAGTSVGRTSPTPTWLLHSCPQALTNANLRRERSSRGRTSADTTSRGFTAAQLYSTAELSSERTSAELDSVGNDLAGWDFSEQNLSNSCAVLLSDDDASNLGTNLTGANLTGADLYTPRSRTRT